MARAASKSIVHSRAMRAARTIVDSIRQIVSPTIFADPVKRTILFPVPDDRWAPDCRCGEFAVVETTSVEPEDGAFVLVRLSHNDFKMAKLRLWSAKEAATVGSGKSEEAPYWSMRFGRQRVLNWRPEFESWAPGGFIHMADGPAGDEFMRSMIVGRVVGVLGANDRALNWKGES